MLKKEFLDVFIRSFGFYHVGLSEIVSCIDFGRPCLGVIETTSGLLHMVEIVGYFDNDNSNLPLPEFYQCIDPGTGEYITIRIKQFEKYAENIYSK